MSLNNFIPEVWATGLLRNLHKQLVFGQANVINSDYEGEIANLGDTVRINAIGPVTVRSYTKDTDIANPDALTDAQTALFVEKADYFNFAIDDVDRLQQQPKAMDEAMYEAAYAMGTNLDTYLAGLYTDVASSNMIGSDGAPKTLTAATDMYPYITELKRVLDEANVPQAGRWLIVPPWCQALMLQDDRFVRSFDPAQFPVLRTGTVAQAAGFDILLSNNVTANGNNYRIMAGYPGAWTLAQQVNKVEAYRPPLRFADAMKGLHLYGAKVTRPQGLALLTVTKYVYP